MSNSVAAEIETEKFVLQASLSHELVAGGAAFFAMHE